MRCNLNPKGADHDYPNVTPEPTDPTKANVRKTGALSGIEELAGSIEAHGLLQNLTVRAAVKGKFEVVAGGRRLAAMTILRRQNKLTKDFLVPCHFIEDADAAEISLAENVVRLAMHPADQFVAFNGLAEQGMGIEDIAARFGVSPAVVRQRLKLASVSPVLIGVYREGHMTLDQLMAFTVTDDHAAQVSAWFDQPDYNRRPQSIRTTLTEAQVEADDRRVRFVGVDAYLAAGGGMNRDLFQPEHEGYLTDPALLDRLVGEKLSAAADEVRGEGWAWVEIMPMRDHAALAGFGRLRPTTQPMDEAMREQHNALMAQYDDLVAEHGDDPEPDIAAQLGDLWQQIEAIETATRVWSPDDITRAGAVLSPDYDGDLIIERGLIRSDDMRRRQSVDGAEASHAEQGAKPKGLSATLTESLTAERTAALRGLLMDNKQVALASLCHALALALFYPYTASTETSLQIRLSSRRLESSAESIDSSRAGILLAERCGSWEARLPEEADDLFGWLLVQDAATVTELLAYCAAQSIDAVRGKNDAAGSHLIAHADAIATSLSLDMRDWWSPTPANYLGRVSKALMLDAVREGVTVEAADNLATLKKDRLAELAGQRLAGTGWLPALLRSPALGEEALENEMKAAA